MHRVKFLKAILLHGVLVATVFATQYLFALAGEPRATWLFELLGML